MRHVLTRRFGQNRSTRRRHDEPLPGSAAPRAAGAARPCVEAMEARRLLAADGAAVAAEYIPSLEVLGTGGDDVMTIERVGFDDVRITVNSTSTTYDMDDVGEYALRGLGGNDTITKIGDIEGAVAPAVSLSGGEGIDTLKGTDATFHTGEVILDPSGRTVATREGDTLRIEGTGSDDEMSLVDFGDGPLLRINDSFSGLIFSDHTTWAVSGYGGSDILSVGEFFPGTVFLIGDGGHTDAGNDVFDVAHTTRTFVFGGAGDDLLRARGNSGEPLNIQGFEGGTGSDTIELDDQGGVDLNDFPDVENVTNAHGVVIGNSLSNIITATPGDLRPLEARGGDGDDFISGGDGDDQLLGEGDNDRLFGNGGNDYLAGGEGDDYSDGGPGTDFIDPGPGEDTEINGENLPGSEGGIVYDANDRSVTVTGTSGPDTISLERVGTDDVRVTLNGTVRTFDLDDVGQFSVHALGGNDTITALGNFLGRGMHLNGGAGTDTISANRADFVGGEVYRDGTRTVATSDGAGELVILGTAGNDTIRLRYDTEGPIVEVNTSFAGVFSEGEHNEYTVNAGAGNDNILVGSQFPGSSADAVVVFGQDGNDVFTLEQTTRSFIQGGAGDDVLRPLGGPDDAFENVGGFQGGTGIDTIELDNQGGVDLNFYEDVENVTNAHGTVRGNALDNRITVRAGDTRAAVLYGRGGSDTLTGGAGNDQLFGEEGDDSLFGNAGDDFLDGGPGVDRLEGGSGNNTLVNGESAPQIFIAADRTLTANGTTGADTFRLERVGTDDVRVTVNGVVRTFDMDDFDRIHLHGGDGNDTMTAGTGVRDFWMYGNAGADGLTGNEQRNILSGGTGNDTLNGGGGDDTLFGEIGNDTLTGGAGADQLFGGDGDDTFFARDNTADEIEGEAGTDRSQHDAIDQRRGVEQTIA